MLETMTRNWWMLLVRGFAAVLFGIAALLTPGIALAALVLVWGAYALIDGVVAIISAFTHRQTNPNWWIVLLEGVAGVIAGILTFAWPAITALVLLYIISAWAIVTGIFEIIAAFQLRKEITGEFWLGLSGLLSVAFGILLLVNPGDGILALLWVVGIYAIMFGVSLILLAFRVRGMANPNAPQAA